MALAQVEDECLARISGHNPCRLITKEYHGYHTSHQQEVATMIVLKDDLKKRGILRCSVVDEDLPVAAECLQDQGYLVYEPAVIDTLLGTRAPLSPAVCIRICSYGFLELQSFVNSIVVNPSSILV
jgi:hypothetical protein